jgi:AcrR family transcriptional regulator
MSVLSASKRTYMKSEARRAQIRACASAVFADRGFHSASIADICERAGIGRGTLYQHFDNKRDVFFAVVDEIGERVAQVIASRPRLAPMDGIEAAPPQLIAAYCAKRLRELLDAVFADEASVRLVLREAHALDGGLEHVLERLDRAVLAAFVADLETARTLGLIRCEDPHLTAMFVMGGVEKMILAAVESGDPIDLDRIVRVAIQIQLFGLLGDRTRSQAHPVNDTNQEETNQS